MTLANVPQFGDRTLEDTLHSYLRQPWCLSAPPPGPNPYPILFRPYSTQIQDVWRLGVHQLNAACEARLWTVQIGRRFIAWWTYLDTLSGERHLSAAREAFTSSVLSLHRNHRAAVRLEGRARGLMREREALLEVFCERLEQAFAASVCHTCYHFRRRFGKQLQSASTRLLDEAYTLKCELRDRSHLALSRVLGHKRQGAERTEPPRKRFKEDIPLTSHRSPQRRRSSKSMDHTPVRAEPPSAKRRHQSPGRLLTN